MKIDMKKMNIGAFVVSGGLLLAASGCTESDFDSKYEDPSKVNQVTISNLTFLRLRLTICGQICANIRLQLLRRHV